MSRPITTEDRLEYQSQEYAEDTIPTCAWCDGSLADQDADDCTERNGEWYHDRCLWQLQDEDELVEFLDQIARDCMEKVKEYESTHKTRALERDARRLIAQIQRVVAACALPDPNAKTYTSPLKFELAEKAS